MALKRRRQPDRQDERFNFRINENIMAREVRLVGEGIEAGVYPLSQALKMAEEAGTDLVEISPQADPPVCKLVDFDKFLYEKKKKLKQLKANAAKSLVKEIRFGPNTDEHDFQFKLKHAVGFLNDGAKVRAYVHFRGRSIVHSSRGELLLLRFAKELDEYAKVEQLPKLEGKRMFLLLAPKKK